ncbi:hypothetical protein L227DRAFT_249078 [Lentinus tigrinus ALCF2SS1-6]|uniref:Uncharacterized protein n=1 Tax=Lentinus tigrinus ALCF2SS1-6 TaxID=1328759 RepID=A0A5C2RZZ7_9APHY|nr:hypothetical protein L227DRAFT_249078 [Lentinus tigrinus ALCF2SS1-6]
MSYHSSTSNEDWVVVAEPSVQPADGEDARGPVWDYTETLRISVGGDTGLCLEDVDADDVGTSITMLVDQANNALPREDDVGRIVVGISPDEGPFEFISELEYEGTTIGDVVTVIVERLLESGESDGDVWIFGLVRGENSHGQVVFSPDLEGE